MLRCSGAQPAGCGAAGARRCGPRPPTIPSFQCLGALARLAVLGACSVPTGSLPGVQARNRRPWNTNKVRVCTPVRHCPALPWLGLVLPYFICPSQAGALGAGALGRLEKSRSFGGRNATLEVAPEHRQFPNPPKENQPRHGMRLVPPTIYTWRGIWNFWCRT